MTDTLKIALADLLEAADSMAGTYCCIPGRHPEEDDTHTHDEWAEQFLKERADAARAVIAAIDAQQAAPVALTPLTDEQIWRAVGRVLDDSMVKLRDVLPLARAIERAHGIGAAAQGGEHVE